MVRGRSHPTNAIGSGLVWSNQGEASLNIFDCHLDLAWNALTWRRDLKLPLSTLNAMDPATEEKFRGRATTTLPEMRRANVAVCLATVMGRVPYGEATLHGSTLDFATHQQVYAFARSHLAYYEALQRDGQARLISTATELKAHWKEWSEADDTIELPIGIILSMEGCDAIPTPQEASHWFEMGLRTAGLVHYGTSKYAVGTGVEGPITADGVSLLGEFERLGVILDVTHLSDESFATAMEVYSGPIVATHQACRALVPGQRQFADDQLREVIYRNGVVCIPCDAWMLYPDWVRGETTREVVSIEAMADHVDHVCQLAGNSHHAAIGSDLDGGYGTEQTPSGLDSIADLQKLRSILDGRGYSENDIRRILGENALRFFSKHLPE